MVLFTRAALDSADSRGTLRESKVQSLKSKVKNGLTSRIGVHPTTAKTSAPAERRRRSPDSNATAKEKPQFVLFAPGRPAAGTGPRSGTTFEFSARRRSLQRSRQRAPRNRS